MPRSRRDKDASSGHDLWTIEGTVALIRKLKSDPGLDTEFRERAIYSVIESALGRELDVFEMVPELKVYMDKGLKSFSGE